MFEQLADVIGRAPDCDIPDEVAFARTFYYPDNVVGFIVAALMKAGEPFKAIPTENGYFLSVRMECRENHIKTTLWNDFPDLQKQLKKMGFSKPRLAYHLKPYCKKGAENV